MPITYVNAFYLKLFSVDTDTDEATVPGGVDGVEDGAEGWEGVTGDPDTGIASIATLDTVGLTSVATRSHADEVKEGEEEEEAGVGEVWGEGSTAVPTAIGREPEIEYNLCTNNLIIEINCN